MKKLKQKIIFIIILALSTLFVMQFDVKGKGSADLPDLGVTFPVPSPQTFLQTHKNTFCINHGNGFKGATEVTFTAVYQIDIIGRNSVRNKKGFTTIDENSNESKTVTDSDYNAMMAYLIGTSTDGYGKWESDGSGYSGTQLAIYKIWNEFAKEQKFESWVDKDNTEAGKNTTEYKNAKSYATDLKKAVKKVSYTDNTIKTSTKKVDTSLVCISNSDVEQYKNSEDDTISSFGSNNNFKNYYIKVGPFNWTWTGTLGSITIKDQNKDKVSEVLYYAEIDKKCYIGDDNLVKNELNGKNFYILLSPESGVSSINAVAKVKCSYSSYDGSLILLEASGIQRLMIGEFNKKTHSDSCDINQTYKLDTLNVTINKEDIHDKTPIVGVKFIIQHETGLYVKKTSDGTIKYVQEKDKATEFVTWQYGSFIVSGIVKGAYTVEEDDVGQNNKYEYSGSEGNTFKITVEGSANGGTEQTKTLYNMVNEKSATVTGKVWVPAKTDKECAEIGDTEAAVYKDTYYLLNDITVELWQRGKLKANYSDDESDKGNLESVTIDDNDEEFPKYITSTETKNGTYTFENVPYYYSDFDLECYYVVFKYDGMTYRACSVQNYKEKENGSKAMETKSINANDFAIITGTGDNDLKKGYAIDDDGNISYNLEYEYGYDENEQKYKSIITNMSSSIDGSSNSSVAEAKYDFLKGTPVNNPGARDYLNSNNNTVYGINLALIVRESPDLTVSNNIENVVTTINGYNNIYLTGMGTNSDGSYNTNSDNSTLKVGVTYVTEEEKLTNFTVYPSDVKTWAEDSKMLDSNKLQVYITYKVGITNESTTLYNRVKELAIYYDKNYELLYVGDSLDTTKYSFIATDSYTKEYKSEYSSNNDDVMSAYSKVYIDMSDSVIKHGGSNEEDTTKYIYMTYKVSDNYVKSMLKTDDSGNITDEIISERILTMKNVVEINAYSTYSDEAGTDLYAGIDKDSAPGNMKKVDEIDDDTGVATEFKVSAKTEDRTLTGTVFLDATDDELNTGEERKGDSIYNSEDGDKLLEGVTVKLIGQSSSSTNIVTGKPVTTVGIEYTASDEGVTGDNTYIISGFIPGDYTIEYTYGGVDKDGEYVTKTVDKETSINTLDYKSAIVYDVGGQTEVKTAFIDGKTDWYKIDNPKNEEEEEETEFIRYSEAVDDWTTRGYIDDYYKTVDMSNTGDVNETTSMTATTPLMEIAIELNTTSNGNSYTPEYYNIINMDFGITERPRQQIELTKEVSTVKLTLANGQVLIDAVLEDGELTNTVSGMKVMGVSSSTPKGSIDIELDSELIHGATLEIGYTIKITNTSELDYTYEEYYKYGTGGTNEVTLNNVTIVDYVSNDLVFDEENNEGWEILDNIEWRKGDDTKTYLYIGDSDTEMVIDDKLITDEKSNTTLKSSTNTIIQIELTELELTPNKSKTIELNLTKLLSNSDESMTYENDIELITATKTGGRSLLTQLGTYTFEGGTGVGASSQEVTITPPTGTTETNITYYIIGATIALIVLAGGITFIVIRRKK